MAKRIKHFRYAEDNIRRELDGDARSLSSGPRESLGMLDGIPDYVERLKGLYEQDRNPVHVWDAIMQLHFYAMDKRLPWVLPSWVQAYLVRAAQGIMGTAVNRPELQQAGRDAGKKPTGHGIPPERNEKGGNHHFSNWFAGCRPADRLRFANEALGFLENQGGANPFLREHRRVETEILLRRAAELKSEGLTDEQIVQRLDHPRLKQVGNPVRWLRRAREKASQ